MPDLGLVTADDMVRNAAMIASLDRSIPVIADADTGYGGTVMVERTVGPQHEHSDDRWRGISLLALLVCTSRTRS